MLTAAGANGMAEIKAHEFFEGIDWDVRCMVWMPVRPDPRQALYRREITPPFKPVLSGADDLHYFDPEYLKMAPTGAAQAAAVAAGHRPQTRRPPQPAPVPPTCSGASATLRPPSWSAFRHVHVRPTAFRRRLPRRRQHSPRCDALDGAGPRSLTRAEADPSARQTHAHRQRLRDHRRATPHCSRLAHGWQTVLGTGALSVVKRCIHKTSGASCVLHGCNCE